MKQSRILVWDLPTRAFHWLLALSFAGAYLTAESERLRNVHVALGYTMLGLVAFRLLWGLVGTRYARFASFAFGPRSVAAYLRSLLTRSPKRYVGHNPAGSWAIYALLALSVAAGATGYATYVDLGGHWMEEVHELAANALLAVVIAHVAGVLLSSLLHRENLVRSMLTGYKRGEADAGIRFRHRAVAALLLAGVAAFWVAGPESLSLTSAGPSAQAPGAGAAAHRDDD
jgi:cytochrome b